ncbi:MAG: radical SAM protein [Bacteroidia bacterium]|nr:radical SAM protein [Bacteroidia bacterium]
MIEKLMAINQKVYPQHLFHDPKWLVLGVNNTCNLHCKMCDVGVNYNQSNFYQNLMGSQPVHMPLELFQKIVDQARTYFPKVKLGYAFTEPLVYKHLHESLVYAKSKNMFTSITTNALNLKKMADKLIDGGLDELYISLDGPADIHNEIRGYKLSFEKAVEGIDYLFSKDNAPKISIFCVITQWNIGRLKEFADYFRKYPLTQIGFMHTNYTPDSVAETHNAVYGAIYPATASNMQDIDISGYDLDLLHSEIQEIKKSDFPFKVTFSPEIDSRDQLDVFYHKPEKKYGNKCYDAFNMVMIKSNGDVIPAHGRCYNLKIGNLYDSTLRDIWNSPVISRFRKDLNTSGGLLPACSRCCSAFN